MASSQSKQSAKKRCLSSDQTTQTSIVDLQEDEIRAEDEDDTTDIPTPKSYLPHPTKKPRPGHRYIQKGKRRAQYWADYELYLDDDNRVRAECQYCDSTFAADSVTNGTKNLKNHFGSCEMNPNNLSKGKQSQLVFEPIDGQEGEAKLKSRIVSHEDIRHAITYMLVLDELAFRQVEKPGFRYFMSVVCPTFAIPSRWTIARDCYKFYLSQKEKLKDLLHTSCQRVCVTTDTWTSIQRINYMCVTSHFIDSDWKLHKRILNFCPISSHKGEAIGRAVEDCLDAWGISEKLFTITIDNASSNDVACAYLKSLTRQNGYIADGKYLHMRCIAHIINLIVWDGLKEHVTCIDKVRYAVRFVRGSPARKILFQEQVEKCKVDCKLSLSLDVPTRWNSTYTMLATAVKYKTVFSRIKIPWDAQDKECVGAPTFQEWDKIERLVVFLKEFYDLTHRISGSLYVTSNSNFFHIGHTYNLLNQCLMSDDVDFIRMAEQMKAKYDKYWGNIDKMNMMIYLGVILDPNLKFVGLQITLNTMYGKEKGEALGRKIKEFAYDIFAEYRRIYAPMATENGENYDIPTSIPPLGGGSLAFMNSISEQVKMKLRGSDVGFGDIGSGSFVRTELDRYLDEQKGDDEEHEILAWWKLNEPRFSILARMARDVLAIPISTVASESAFSTGGRTLDKFRSSLTPKTAQGLICGQDWIRAEIRKDIINVEETVDELEKLEKELEGITLDDKTIFVTDAMI